MITEETLLLYFYHDGLTRNEREQVDQALKHDVELAKRYALLCQDMDSLRDQMTESVAPVKTGRWQRALDDEIDAELLSKPLRPWLLQNHVLATAATVTVFVAGLVIGGQLNDETMDQPVEPVAAHIVEPPGPSISKPAPALFVRGIATHFETTQIQLASMDINNVVERDELIQKIVSQNRFFIKAANQNDAENVARLLRAFEPLLLSMSSGGGHDESRSAEQIRGQLEFELGVTLTKFSQQTSNRSNEF